MNATKPTPCDTCNGLGAIRPDSAYFTPCGPRHPSAETCHGCDGSCVDHTAAAEQLARECWDGDRDDALTGAEAYALYNVADDLPGDDAKDAFAHAWDVLRDNDAEARWERSCNDYEHGDGGAAERASLIGAGRSHLVVS